MPLTLTKSAQQLAQAQGVPIESLGNKGVGCGQTMRAKNNTV